MSFNYDVSCISFSKLSVGQCPSYYDFYIQDRCSGIDVHGNQTYEYALFLKQHFEVVKRFRTRKQAYFYVSSVTGLSRFDIKYGSSSIVINDCDYLGVIYGDTMYRITRRTCEVSKRPLNDKQLTRWYIKYNDCLSDAKEIIKNSDYLIKNSVDYIWSKFI